jgi:hypothetical protein
MTPNIQCTRRLSLAWPAALSCLILAGCGASAGFADKVMASLSPTAPVPSTRADHDAPTIFVTIPSLGVSGGMARISLRGSVSEWRSADGIGLTLQGGQIIATRGLGPDLLIADVDGAGAALRLGHGEFSRTMHWLDGENHDRSEEFTCTLRIAETQANSAERALIETCAGPQTAFTNSYAVSATSGAPLRSDQWVSPGLGSIQIELR